MCSVAAKREKVHQLINIGGAFVDVHHAMHIEGTYISNTGRATGRDGMRRRRRRELEW